MVVSVERLFPGDPNPLAEEAKPFALVENAAGVPPEELSDLIGFQEETTDTATVISDATGVTSLGVPVNRHHDAVQVVWSRNGTVLETIRFPVAFLGDSITRQINQDITHGGAALDTPVGRWTSISDATTLRGYRYLNEHTGRSILFGLNSPLEVEVQADDLTPDADTLQNGDTCNIRHLTYDEGIVGGKFLKLHALNEPRLVVWSHSHASQTTPTGITYRGNDQYPVIPPTVLYSDVRDDAPGTETAQYWIAPTTLNRNALTWTVGTWEHVDASQLQASADGVTWHAMPWERSTDRFLRYRESVTSEWETIISGGDLRPHPRIVVEGDWMLRNAGGVVTDRLDLTLGSPIDLDDYSFLILYWNWDADENGADYRPGLPHIIPVASVVPKVEASGNEALTRGNTLRLKWTKRHNSLWTPVYGSLSKALDGTNNFYADVNFTRDSGDHARLLRKVRLFGASPTTANSNGHVTVYMV